MAKVKTYPTLHKRCMRNVLHYLAREGNAQSPEACDACVRFAQEAWDVANDPS